MAKIVKHEKWILKKTYEVKVKCDLGDWNGVIEDIGFSGACIVFDGFTPPGISPGDKVEVEIPYLEPMAEIPKKKIARVVVCLCKNNKLEVMFEQLPATDPALFNNIGYLLEKEGTRKRAE